MNQIYFVKCRRFTETKDIKQRTTKKCYKASARFVERKRASVLKVKKEKAS